MIYQSQCGGEVSRPSPVDQETWVNMTEVRGAKGASGRSGQALMPPHSSLLLEFVEQSCSVLFCPLHHTPSFRCHGRPAATLFFPLMPGLATKSCWTNTRLSCLLFKLGILAHILSRHNNIKISTLTGNAEAKMGERQCIAQKGVRAIDARNSWLEKNGLHAAKPVFALPGCQRTSVNTLLCDTLGLADKNCSFKFLSSICTSDIEKSHCIHSDRMNQHTHSYIGCSRRSMEELP